MLGQQIAGFGTPDTLTINVGARAEDPVYSRTRDLTVLNHRKAGIMR